MTPAEADIPTYRIDLADPPELRYKRLAEDFSERIQRIVPLFDEVLHLFIPSRALVGVAKFASRLALRGVYDAEQNEEIKSIARAAGVSVHLAVALNVFLDMMLGCTSGAALARVAAAPKKSSSAGRRDRLLHFRTLDWEMASLRDLLVVLEFVDSRKGGAERVIASSITYAGFVGVLTGVREGLSLSLNFRPVHNCKTSLLLTHQLLVLLGFREAVPSVLRRVLLATDDAGDTESTASAPADSHGQDSGRPVKTKGIADLARRVASMRTTPCYLTLCDGDEVAVIQKDVVDGNIKTSPSFMIQTNHDADHSPCCGPRPVRGHATQSEAELLADYHVLGIEESEDRLESLRKRWVRHVKVYSKNSAKRSEAGGNGTCIDSFASETTAGEAEIPGVKEATLRRWVSAYPTTNEMSHFTTIMDPTTGEIRWLARGPDAADDSSQA